MESLYTSQRRLRVIDTRPDRPVRQNHVKFHGGDVLAKARAWKKEQTEAKYIDGVPRTEIKQQGDA